MMKTTEKIFRNSMCTSESKTKEAVGAECHSYSDIPAETQIILKTWVGK